MIMLTTLLDTLQAQNNLSQLCADRTLETIEIFQPNAFYGIDFIIKTYARIPQNYSLKGVFPHGIFLGKDYLWETELQAPVPTIFTYTSTRKALYKQATRKRIILSAFPFLYVCELLKEHPNPKRQGTIYFPLHSSQYVTLHMDFERVAEQLITLEERFQPVTICIYWRDYNLGRHLPFQRRGLRVVSAGHIYDPLFLFRLYHLCSSHQYAASTDSGGHLFYSIKAGCSYFTLQAPSNHYVSADNDTILRRDFAGSPLQEHQKFMSLFTTPQTSTTPEQMSAVDALLGTAYVKSPAHLRMQLFQAEVIYQFVHFLFRIRQALFHQHQTS